MRVRHIPDLFLLMLSSTPARTISYRLTSEHQNLITKHYSDGRAIDIKLHGKMQ